MSGADIEGERRSERGVQVPHGAWLQRGWLHWFWRRSRAWRLGVIALLAIAGLIARIWLAPELGERLAHALFYPALLAAALLFEIPAGLAVYAFALASVHLPLFGPPLAPLAAAGDYLGLAVFTFNSAMLLLLARALQNLAGARDAVAALDRINAEQLGHFVEQAPAAMAMFDRDMRYLAASARWRDQYHLQRDIVGKSHYDVFPEIGEEWKKVHARALAGETVRAECDLFHRADGGGIWLRWEVRPWHHPRDGIGGVLIYTEDITERLAIRQALEDKERRLTAILDSAMEAIVTIGADGEMVSANPAACEMFGYTEAELVGQNVRLLMPARYRAEHDAFLAAYLGSGEKRIIGRRRELEGKRKGGEAFQLELTVSEARNNGGAIFVGFMRDLSPIEAERRRVNALRDELIHVSRLNDMGEVVAGLAHEVGQPIAAILNFAAAYRRSSGGAPGAETEAMGRIEAQARRAGEILRRLREFIEKRPSLREPEDAASLIAEALKLSPVRRAKVRFRPSADELFEVCVDRIQFEQVVINLLRNADQALRDSAAPEIQIAIDRPDPDHVRVSIADNGPGVDPEAQARIFTAFFSTRTFGMGVGLAICKSIVEDHGGEIAYRANVPTGAVFSFTLPVWRPESP